LKEVEKEKGEMREDRMAIRGLRGREAREHEEEKGGEMEKEKEDEEVKER
jgi:hypothetical protein